MVKENRRGRLAGAMLCAAIATAPLVVFAQAPAAAQAPQGFPPAPAPSTTGQAPGSATAPPMGPPPASTPQATPAPPPAPPAPPTPPEAPPVFQGATMYSSQPFQRSPSPTFPLCDTSGTPSPCVHPTDAYRHDGFYLRLTGGPSYVAFSGSGRSGGASVSGLGSGETIAVGGTPATGVAVAGAFRVLSDRDQFHGSPHQPEGYASVGSVGVGLLVDWFPSATGGWHVGGMAAVTALVMTDSWIADSSGGAYTGTILGGYDWWIGPQWSLGVMAVLSASTSAKLADEHGNDTGYRFNAFSAGLEYALTLH